MAMGHNLWLHFGVDEHPFATYYVHQGYRVLTHSQMGRGTAHPLKSEGFGIQNPTADEGSPDEVFVDDLHPREAQRV